MQLKNIRLSDMDWDDLRFCLSTSIPKPVAVPPDFADEVNFPLLVRPAKREGSWTILFGYSLAAAARDQGRKEVLSLCLGGQEADERKCLQIGYRYRRQIGELSLMEKAALVFRLNSLAGCSEQETMDIWLKVLQLPPNLGTVTRLRQLAAWPPTLTHLAESSDLNPLVLLALAELPLSAVEGLILLFQRFRWTHSRQKEILRLFLDLSMIQEKALPEICQECLQVEVQQPTEAGLPQRAEAVRRYLLEKRYPRRREAEVQYQEYRRALHLPPEIQLLEPADFEGESFRIQFTFRNRQEFEYALTSLSALSQKQSFEDLFRLL